MWRLGVVLFSLLSKDLGSDAARILAIFPYPSYSHSSVFHTVMLGLAERGHDVVVCTANPTDEDVPPNYTQIYLDNLEDIKKRHLQSAGFITDWRVMRPFEMIGNVGLKEEKISPQTKHPIIDGQKVDRVKLTLSELVDAVFAHPRMSRFTSRNSTEKFDLVVIEWIVWVGVGSFAHKFSTPLIGITSMTFDAYNYYSVGNPLSAAYSSGNILPYTDQMNMWERCVNLLYKLKLLYDLDKHLEDQDAISKKYLGNDTPHIREIFKNVSLILDYTDPVMFYPQPNVPANINIAGVALSRKKKTVELPPSLSSFLDGAKEGFVYFSLGSTVSSSAMSDWTRQQFLEAFAELPYRVLWKWENETLPGKPDNVFVSKWLPQRQILAHPNIRVYLYQGGCQSSEEAVAHAVPIVGIPLFLDQEKNVRKLESVGIGKGIYTRLDSITKEQVRSALLEVINDPGYKERATKFRDLRNDRPEDVLDKAVWWIEHVIRHKGARHLRVRAMDLTWYQLIYLDVIAVASFVSILAIASLYYAIKFTVRRLLNAGKSPDCKVKTT